MGVVFMPPITLQSAQHTEKRKEIHESIISTKCHKLNPKILWYPLMPRPACMHNTLLSTTSNIKSASIKKEKKNYFCKDRHPACRSQSRTSVQQSRNQRKRKKLSVMQLIG